MLLARKYSYSFFLGFKRTLEYRMSFLLGLLSSCFPIVIQYYLWTAIYRHSTESLIFGYSYRQMLLYVVLASIISLLVSTGFEWEIAADIKEGGLNLFLVKPVGYFSYRISCFLGGKLIQLIMISALIIGLTAYYQTVLAYEFSLLRLIAFFICLLNAIVMNFIIFYALSMVAFWMSEVWGVFAGFGVLNSLFSGGLFPIDVLGPFLNGILTYLPFKYIIYFPINVLTRSLSAEAVYTGIGIQLAWIAALFIVSQCVWRLGAKKYVSIGG